MSRVFRTTGRNAWETRPPMGEAQRRHIHGPIVPMERRVSFWERLFGVGRP